MYFAQYFNNSLYKIKNNIIQYVGTAPCDFPFNTRQHVSSIVNDNIIYLLPCNSNTIVSYDIINNKWNVMPLEIKHIVFKPWKYENNFRNGLIYKNRIYLFPSYYSAIVYFDLETKETVHCIDLNKIKESINYKDDILFVNFVYENDHSVLIPFIHSNHVLEFNLDTFEYKIHTIGQGKGFISIYKYGDSYWLLERQKSIICKWRYGSDIVEYVEPYPPDLSKTSKKSIFGTLSTFLKGNELYCFAGYSNMSVKVDLETGRSTHLTELDKYRNEKNDNEKMLVFHSAAIANNIVYLHYISGDSIVKYNIITGETNELFFSIKDTVAERDIETLNKITIKNLLSLNSERNVKIDDVGYGIHCILD